ncbi:competence type IV pilus major pilin ComGC [Catenisphaera adipataccumulans]|jgi:competence protein ComGC|uniref:Competence protein ComGC n=1 Tax=Catenisphaera adipataccumulans TaxID=700500 RepID=A0A7W8CZC5_9FIRM|nr:competence type IV pilus major pilin ComGC [Catenisphaera adipataccumulans]MBB5183213.1 competence protein ComGC [Catenisphaera adipataccumulans]
MKKETLPDEIPENRNAFTVLEMMIVMLVIALLLLITLPNIQQKEKIIRAKGCSALLDVVNSQIVLYEINELKTPTSVSQLIQKGYLKKGQDRCPNGQSVVIVNGDAKAQ